MATERIFGELASLAAIPASTYSVGEEVDGAMCLLETADGFEVFTSAGGSRHEVRVFSDEESACSTAPDSSPAAAGNGGVGSFAASASARAAMNASTTSGVALGIDSSTSRDAVAGLTPRALE